MPFRGAGFRWRIRRTAHRFHEARGTTNSWCCQRLGHDAGSKERSATQRSQCGAGAEEVRTGVERAGKLQFGLGPVAEPERAEGQHVMRIGEAGPRRTLRMIVVPPSRLRNGFPQCLLPEPQQILEDRVGLVVAAELSQTEGPIVRLARGATVKFRLRAEGAATRPGRAQARGFGERLSSPRTVAQRLVGRPDPIRGLRRGDGTARPYRTKRA